MTDELLDNSIKDILFNQALNELQQIPNKTLRASLAKEAQLRTNLL